MTWNRAAKSWAGYTASPTRISPGQGLQLLSSSPSSLCKNSFMGTGGQYRIRPALWDPVPPEPACWHRAIYQTAPGWGVLGGTLVGMSLLTVSRQAVQKGLPAAFCSPLVRSGVGRGANKNQSITATTEQDHLGRTFQATRSALS